MKDPVTGPAAPAAPARPQRREPPLFFVLYYLLYVSVLLRMVLLPASEGIIGPVPYALMAGFLFLSVLQPALARLPLIVAHAHLLLLTAITVALLMIDPELDFYAVLFLCISIIATRNLPFGQDLAWLGFISATIVWALAVDYGLREAAVYMPAYLAGSLAVGLYGRASRKAEVALARSTALLAQLEDANRRLRLYAERAEEAAAGEERTRLARELHDAVTQTVFSMNLTAEAANGRRDRAGAATRAPCRDARAARRASSSACGGRRGARKRRR